MMDLILAKQRYKEQLKKANSRKIEWQFTFENWLKIWIDSGKWDQRGCRKGQYVMSRFGDVGPYSPNNVVIKLCSENLSEAHIGKKITRSADHQKKINDTNRGRTYNHIQVSCVSCKKAGAINLMKRYHLLNCKSGENYV